MMNDPIPISKEPNWSADDMIKMQDAAHKRHTQTGFLVILGVIILSFFVPLGVFLTRFAMGIT